MRLETPKAVSKISRPMSEHTERTSPIGLDQRRPVRGPRRPKVNCQLVVGHEIVKLPALPRGAPWRRRADFLTFSNVDKKAKAIILPISSPNISVDLSIWIPTKKGRAISDLCLWSENYFLNFLLSPKRPRRPGSRKGDTPFSLLRLPEVGVIGLGS